MHTKKKERATVEQLKIFLDYCSKHPEIMYREKRHAEEVDRLWAELTEQLNVIRGPIRTCKQWKRTLYHWKDQVISRVRRIGMMGLNEMPKDPVLCLTKFDTRALKVFGLNVDDILHNSTECRFNKVEQKSVDQTHLPSLSDTASVLHEMELPLDKFHEDLNSNDNKRMFYPQPVPSTAKISSPQKRRAEILSPVYTSEPENKRPFTEEIVSKLNDIDSKLTALNINLSRIANAIEKIADKF